MGTVLDGALTWRRLVATDLPMLSEWLREPQVARWCNHEHTAVAVELDFGASVRGEEPGEDLVVALDGHPVGLLQRSVIRDYPDDLAEFAAIVDVPEGSVELDYLIADAALWGRGLGSRMIAAAVQSTWEDYSATPAERRVVAGAREGGAAAHRGRRDASRQPRRRPAPPHLPRRPALTAPGAMAARMFRYPIPERGVRDLDGRGQTWRCCDGLSRRPVSKSYGYPRRMRRLLPWAGGLIVLIALWPTICASAEDGPTKCNSLLLPLPCGENADTWGIAAAVVVAAVVYVVLRLLVGRRHI